MTINLMNTDSEINCVNKNITTLVSLTGTLKDESSLIDPIVVVSDINEYIPHLNYAHIPDFGRYYFVTGVDSISDKLWRIIMHVDVLYTYRDAILANSAIIARNENSYDLKLNDGLFKTQQNPRISQFEFPSGFNTWDFVLAIAGN